MTELCVGATVVFKTIQHYTPVTDKEGVVFMYLYHDTQGEDGPVGATYWYVKFPDKGVIKVNQDYLKIVRGGRVWVGAVETPVGNGQFLVTPAHWENQKGNVAI